MSKGLAPHATTPGPDMLSALIAGSGVASSAAVAVVSSLQQSSDAKKLEERVKTQSTEESKKLASRMSPLIHDMTKAVNDVNEQVHATQAKQSQTTSKVLKPLGGAVKDMHSVAKGLSGQVDEVKSDIQSKHKQQMKELDKFRKQVNDMQHQKERAWSQQLEQLMEQRSEGDARDERMQQDMQRLDSESRQIAQKFSETSKASSRALSAAQTAAENARLVTESVTALQSRSDDIQGDVTRARAELNKDMQKMRSLLASDVKQLRDSYQALEAQAATKASVQSSDKDLLKRLESAEATSRRLAGDVDQLQGQLASNQKLVSAQASAGAAQAEAEARKKAPHAPVWDHRQQMYPHKSSPKPLKEFKLKTSGLDKKDVDTCIDSCSKQKGCGAAVLYNPNHGKTKCKLYKETPELVANSRGYTAINAAQPESFAMKNDQLWHHQSGKCLNVNKRGKGYYGVWKCGPEKQNRWETQDVGGGGFAMKHSDSGECLLANKNRVRVGTCKASDTAQQWVPDRVNDSGVSLVRNKKTDTCLYANKHNQLALGKCTAANDNMLWRPRQP